MKRFYFLSLCILFCLLAMGSSSMLQAQNQKFADRWILGSSLTYIRFSDGPLAESVYNEFSWTNNVAVNINQFVYFGIEYINLFTKYKGYQIEEKNKYYLVGAFTQIDVLELAGIYTNIKERKGRFFVELAYYHGNYCECGFNSLPYQVDGLNYFGFGFGADYPILDWLSIDVAFKSNYNLADISEKTAYNYYILGLNIDIVSKK